jgi:hypothetical protein
VIRPPIQNGSHERATRDGRAEEHCLMGNVIQLRLFPLSNALQPNSIVKDYAFLFIPANVAFIEQKVSCNERMFLTKRERTSNTTLSRFIESLTQKVDHNIISVKLFKQRHNDNATKYNINNKLQSIGYSNQAIVSIRTAQDDKHSNC